MKEQDQSLWLCLYTHRHGIDLDLYSTEQEALRGAAATIAEYIHEIGTEDPKAAREMLTLILQGRYEEALSQWGNWQAENDGEEIEILPQVVDSDKPHIEQILEPGKLAQYLAEYAAESDEETDEEPVPG